MSLFRSARPVRRRLARWGGVLGGIVALQVVLYCPSLRGKTILLPLRLMQDPGFYLVPDAPPSPPVRPLLVLVDLVTHWDLARQFAAGEVRAGRLPVWDPYGYCGAPFADFGKYSLFMLPHYLSPSPVVIAWVQVLKALVAGVGAYLFFRRVLGARFWPAAVGAWVYPLSAFLMLWRGDPISDVAAWYPAALVAVHHAVRRPFGRGVPALAAVTALAVFAGHADIAGQVLVGSGLFAVWSVARRYGVRPTAKWVRPVAGLAVGWGCGLLLSAPYLLPLAEYLKTSQRLALREAGTQERPPGSPGELVRVACPDWTGSHRDGSACFSPNKGSLIESASAAYAGLLALLVAAPFAWADRRRRGINLFLVGTALLGLAWVLNVPGVVHLLKLPGLNILSHNRLTFWTGFAVSALAVSGLSAVWRGGVRWRWGFAAPGSALVALGVWASVRAADLPAEVAAVPEATQAAAPLRESAAATYQGYAALCTAGLAVWAVCFFGRWPAWVPRALAAAVVAEAVWFADGLNPQSDPALYYPRLAALERVKAAGDGRAVGLFCLPANLLSSHGIRDVRGYDAVDPRPILDLIDTARAKTDPAPSYARTQLFVPKLTASAEAGLRLPPALDMLGLRYILTPVRLFPMVPPDRPTGEFFVYENRNALPRAFFPARVTEVEAGDALGRVAAPDFDPRAVAYVTRRPDVPPEARGEARVADEVPARIAVAADTPTGGLLVLGDQWADGWTSTVDGTPAEVVRVNHALKGVAVPPGKHEVVFAYWPPGLTRGLIAAGVGVAVLIGWVVAGRRRAAKSG